MHDPKLLAILNRREPVTLEDFTFCWYGGFNDRSTKLGHALIGMAFEIDTAEIENDRAKRWYDQLAWNLTIAALLNAAARRALYQTNVYGAFE